VYFFPCFYSLFKNAKLQIFPQTKEKKSFDNRFAIKTFSHNYHFFCNFAFWIQTAFKHYTSL